MTFAKANRTNKYDDDAAYNDDATFWDQLEDQIQKVQLEIERVQCAAVNSGEILAKTLDVMTGEQSKQWALAFERAKEGFNLTCGPPQRDFADEIEVEAEGLLQESYCVDNSILKAQRPMLEYHFTKNMKDKAPSGVTWGSTIQGSDEGDGWLRVGTNRFLPMRLNGIPVLIQADEDATAADTACESQFHQHAGLPEPQMAGVPVEPLPDLLDLSD